MRRLPLILLAACASAPAPALAPPHASCTPTVVVHVVNEAGIPLSGATVRSVADVMQCGPSGLAEGCGGGTEETPEVVTDASGSALVCDAAAGIDAIGRAARSEVFHGSAGDVRVEPRRLRSTSSSIVVAYGDWPVARVATAHASRVETGPARALVVDVPIACPGAKHVHVSASAMEVPGRIWAQPVLGGMRGEQFRIEGLGPWRYWVQTNDDRSGNSSVENDACPSYTRAIDGHAIPGAFVLDHSDAVVDLAAFAGGRATVTRADETIASVTLDAEGRATLALPGPAGFTYCLRVETDDRCYTTFARAGEIARPGMYAGREREIETSCGRCP